MIAEGVGGGMCPPPPRAKAAIAIAKTGEEAAIGIIMDQLSQGQRRTDAMVTSNNLIRDTPTSSTGTLLIGIFQNMTSVSCRGEWQHIALVTDHWDCSECLLVTRAKCNTGTGSNLFLLDWSVSEDGLVSCRTMKSNFGEIF